MLVLSLWLCGKEFSRWGDKHRYRQLTRLLQHRCLQRLLGLAESISHSILSTEDVIMGRERVKSAISEHGRAGKEEGAVSVRYCTRAASVIFKHVRGVQEGGIGTNE